MPKLKKHNKNYVLYDFYPGKANDMSLDIGKSIDVDVKITDRRHWTDNQRKFIFALLRDIEYETGLPEWQTRGVLQTEASLYYGYDDKSLSDYSITEANHLIDFIIMYCFKTGVTISGDTIANYDYHFNEKQTYLLTLKRVCCVCGKHADIHHLDHIGMGNDRKKISHIGKRVLPLCRKHHNEAHSMSNEQFIKRYYLTPIKVDEKLEEFIKRGVLKEYKEKKK